MFSMFFSIPSFRSTSTIFKEDKSLGNSQKGEVAFLENSGYKYEAVTVRDFVDSFLKEARSGEEVAV